jgi:hypothetical protein
MRLNENKMTPEHGALLGSASPLYAESVAADPFIAGSGVVTKDCFARRTGFRYTQSMEPFEDLGI